LIAAFSPPLSSAETEQARESFDKDPQWTAHQNWIQAEPRQVVQDFGYSQSQHAGGKAQGEIGGRVHTSSTPAWYATQLSAQQSLDDRLHCTGRLAVLETSGSAGLYFGWFNTQTMATRPPNRMGLLISGEGRGCEVHVSYSTAAGNSDGFRATGTGPKGAKVRDFNLIPLATVYTFELLYDPTANGGVGAITFTLGGDGPFTGGPYEFKLSPEQRKTGATFNAFGICNSQTSGNPLTIYFDDLTVNGRAYALDDERGWTGHGNRVKFADEDIEDAHRFGFSTTNHAGGERGELGGVIYASESTPGHYAADVGKLSLDQPLSASGKVSLVEYAPDGGAYIGWFDASERRGYPPKNILGILVEGPTSTGPALRGAVASADPKLGHVQKETAPRIRADGKPHTWKIEYRPDGAGGRGEVTVWLDDQRDSIALPEGLRKRGAALNRFGLFVYEGGGHRTELYLDDLEYTRARTAGQPSP
jgi:hypothetical protein